MRERVFIILVVLLLSLNGELFAQNGQFSGEKRGITNLSFPSLGLRSPLAGIPVSTGTDFRNFRLMRAPSLTIGAATYMRSLGFFCRQEVQLDKLTPLPFRFRLGSIDYVNYLEQKPNAKWNPVMQ